MSFFIRKEYSSYVSVDVYCDICGEYVREGNDGTYECCGDKKKLPTANERDVNKEFFYEEDGKTQIDEDDVYDNDWGEFSGRPLNHINISNELKEKLSEHFRSLKNMCWLLKDFDPDEDRNEYTQDEIDELSEAIKNYKNPIEEEEEKERKREEQRKLELASMKAEREEAEKAFKKALESMKKKPLTKKDFIMSITKSMCQLESSECDMSEYGFIDICKLVAPHGGCKSCVLYDHEDYKLSDDHIACEIMTKENMIKQLNSVLEELS